MKNTKKSRVLIEYKRMRSEESQIEPLTNLPIYSTSRSKCITLNPPIIVSDFKLNIEWSVSLEKCIDASPLLVKWPNKEVIFIGSHSGLVLAINVQSHVIIWEQRLPDRIESSCVILYGKYIAVGTLLISLKSITL